MIESLNSQMAQKDTELAALNEKLLALNANVAQLQVSVDTLTSQTTAQSETIAEQTTALHTAYYVMGKSKELQDRFIPSGIEPAPGTLADFVKFIATERERLGKIAKKAGMKSEH